MASADAIEEGDWWLEGETEGGERQLKRKGGAEVVGSKKKRRRKKPKLESIRDEQVRRHR